ncbi:SirB1 family protein [Comamonas composti]|uniref:SirB1 family protein n=1 Tax=Comamonas composti TaxID=408558 RepID=UPI0004076984|nr:tetratricopeptide repeat protein [Comamonas composti]
MNWSYQDSPSSLQYFASLVQSDESLPLMEAAISIAQDAVPDLDLQSIIAELDRLQVRLGQRLAGETDTLQILHVLNRFFYGELGFAVNRNDYYDPANSYIHHVLQTRRGIPISVAVIWLELALGLGLQAQGVSFPGHFLVKLRLPQGQIILDPLSGESLSADTLAHRLEPYWQGLGLSADEAAPLGLYLQAASARDILERMLRNLQEIHQTQQDWPLLVAVLNRLALLRPDQPEVYRDRGMAFAKWGVTERAIEDLEHYLQHPAGAEALAVREVVRRLKGL